MKMEAEKGMEKVENIGKNLWEHSQETVGNEDGIAVVELILILVVLIGIVILFQAQLTSLVSSIFNTITNNSSTI